MYKTDTRVWKHSLIFHPLPLADAVLIELTPKGDRRGKFTRLFCFDELKEIKSEFNIVQINHSYTKRKGTIRGLHFQFTPKAEIKMITCIRGKVFDVLVDLRKGSRTYLKWHSVELSRGNNRMIYIPKGFAHGFQTLEEDSELLYFHSDYYSPGHEGGLMYDDDKLKIKWPLDVSEISERDKSYKNIKDEFGGLTL